MQIITAKIHPAAKQKNIIKIDDNNYLIHTTAQPSDNQANNAVIRQLSDYFNVPKSLISIKHGRTNKIKIIEIDR